MDCNEIKEKGKTWLKQKYEKDKIAIWTILIVILIGILPMFPMSSTKEYYLNVSLKEDLNSGRFARQGIEINPNCNSFSSPMNTYVSLSATYYANSGSTGETKTIKFKFKSVNVNIFAIKTCDCIPNEDLSLSEEKTCLMRNSSVFGYFENCLLSNNYGNEQQDCMRQPFVTSDNVEVIPPAGNFKVRFDPYITKTKMPGDQYNPIVERYSVKATITYPDWKPLPYAKWVGTALLFVLDPLKSILRYFIDRWFY